jgi:exodeoxyribonuclease III
VERCSDPRPRRRAGGDPPQPAGRSDDTHSRYIEAAVGGLLVGCLYLPNGNPAPGPKFDYKLRLVERLTGYSQSLLDSGAPLRSRAEPEVRIHLPPGESLLRTWLSAHEEVPRARRGAVAIVGAKPRQQTEMRRAKKVPFG